jgi:hypothetical protein
MQEVEVEVFAWYLRLTECIPQNLRDKLDEAGYSRHGFLLKVAYGLGWHSIGCAKTHV